jgi:hypothetical protein
VFFGKTLQAKTAALKQANRMGLVLQMIMLTIEHGWPVGYGPSGAPYLASDDDVMKLAASLK